MSRFGTFGVARAAALGIFVSFSAVLAGCGAIPYSGDPAQDYVYQSGAPLRVAVIDQTGGNDWTPALDTSIARYGEGSSMLRFQRETNAANIVITVRRYSDAAPPALTGYRFEPGVGGFATVYDGEGAACNFPPANVPVGCSGEIARAEIYLNDIIPAGADIEARRQRLILHEMGHALGLTRHSPDLGMTQLAQRYGW